MKLFYTIGAIIAIFAVVLVNGSLKVSVGPAHIEAVAQERPTALSQAEMNALINSVQFGLKINNALCSATQIDAEHHYLLTANHCFTSKVAVEEVKDKKGKVVTPYKPAEYIYDGELLAGQIDIDEAGNITGKHLYAFTVIAYDAGLDLALIQLTSSKDGDWPTVAAAIACKPPHRLDTIYAVGNPFGNYGYVSKGSIMKVAIMDNGLHIIYYSASTGPGMSGGSVLNTRGQIISVINQLVHDYNTFGIGSGNLNIENFISHIKVPGFTAPACAD